MAPEIASLVLLFHPDVLKGFVFRLGSPAETNWRQHMRTLSLSCQALTVRYHHWTVESHRLQHHSLTELHTHLCGPEHKPGYVYSTCSANLCSHVIHHCVRDDGFVRKTLYLAV